MSYLTVKQEIRLTNISIHSKSWRIRKKAIKRLYYKSIKGKWLNYQINA